MNPSSPNWFFRNRWWVIPLAALGLIVVFGAIIIGLVLLTGISLKKSDVFLEALEKSRTHPEAIAALGEPIEPGWYITGTIIEYESAKSTDLVVMLKGPKARGMLHAEAYREKEEKNFADLTLDVKSIDKRIYLQDELPPHNLKVAKKVQRAIDFYLQNNQDRAIEILDDLAVAHPDQPLVFLTRASMHNAGNDFESVIKDASRVVALYDRSREAYHLRAAAALLSGQLETAREDYTRLIALAPDDPWNINNKAWLLCTAEDDTIRDGTAAVKLAERAAEMSKRKYPGILDTLACAYAETGEFEKAVKIQEEALALEQPPDQKKELQARLIKFKQGKAHRIAAY